MSIKKALLIGINYRGTNAELNGCINDVHNIKKILMQIYGYAEKNILLLTDDTYYKPTAQNIVDGLLWLKSYGDNRMYKKSYYPLSSGTLYLHYSGHGSQIYDYSGDERDGLDEVICPLDYANAGFISDDVIRSYIGNLPTNINFQSIIDACHSGTMFDLKYTCSYDKNSNTYLLNTANNYPLTNANIIMISGCKDEQVSMDINVLGTAAGALTHAFLEALKYYSYNCTYHQLISKIHQIILSSQLPCISFGKNIKLGDNFRL